FPLLIIFHLMPPNRCSLLFTALPPKLGVNQCYSLRWSLERRIPMPRKQMLNRAVHRTVLWRLTAHLWLTDERRGLDLKSPRGFTGSIVPRPGRRAGCARYDTFGWTDRESLGLARWPTLCVTPSRANLMDNLAETVRSLGDGLKD